MFSFTISLIAILLAAILLSVSLYYFNASTEQAEKDITAAALISQGEQILAAVDMRAMDNAHDMSHVDFLTDGKYLSTLPTPPAGTYEQGIEKPSPKDWRVLVAAHKPPIVLSEKLDLETCLLVNDKAGLKGIKSTADPTRRIQCFGAEAPFTMLLNPTAKQWPTCDTNPTLPGCTEKPPYCEANPFAPECIVCEEYPTHPLCKEPEDPCKKDPTLPECNPCVKNPSLPECQPCKLNPNLPECDRCLIDPTLPQCQPCAIDPTLPECQPCKLDPTLPECNPCVTNPSLPECQPCKLNPNLPECDRCLIDPTLPECNPCVTNPSLPECQPCVINPTLPECEPPTCKTHPFMPGCPKFCELYPEHPFCKETPYCELYPDDPICKPVFCELYPEHPFCKETPFCEMFPTHPLCVACPGGDCGPRPICDVVETAPCDLTATGSCVEGAYKYTLLDGTIYRCDEKPIECKVTYKQLTPLKQSWSFSAGWLGFKSDYSGKPDTGPSKVKLNVFRFDNYMAASLAHDKYAQRGAVVGPIRYEKVDATYEVTNSCTGVCPLVADFEQPVRWCDGLFLGDCGFPPIDSNGLHVDTFDWQTYWTKLAEFQANPDRYKLIQGKYYDCGGPEVPVCTYDIAAGLIYDNPELIENSVIRSWVAPEIKWESSLGWVSRHPLWESAPSEAYALLPVSPDDFGPHEDLYIAAEKGFYDSRIGCPAGTIPVVDIWEEDELSYISGKCLNYETVLYPNFDSWSSWNTPDEEAVLFPIVAPYGCEYVPKPIVLYPTSDYINVLVGEFATAEVVIHNPGKKAITLDFVKDYAGDGSIIRANNVVSTCVNAEGRIEAGQTCTYSITSKVTLSNMAGEPLGGESVSVFYRGEELTYFNYRVNLFAGYTELLGVYTPGGVKLKEYYGELGTPYFEDISVGDTYYAKVAVTSTAGGGTFRLAIQNGWGDWPYTDVSNGFGGLLDPDGPDSPDYCITYKEFIDTCYFTVAFQPTRATSKYGYYFKVTVDDHALLAYKRRTGYPRLGVAWQ